MAEQRAKVFPLTLADRTIVYGNVAHRIQTLRVAGPLHLPLPKTVLENTVLVLKDTKADQPPQIVKFVSHHPKEDIGRPPYISIDATEDAGEYNVSFMYKGVEWKPVYTMFVDASDEVMQFVASAILTNRSSDIVDSSSTQLVAGNVNIESDEYVSHPRAMMRGAAAAPEARMMMAQAMPTASMGDEKRSSMEVGAESHEEGELAKYEIGPMVVATNQQVELFKDTLPDWIVKQCYVNLGRKSSASNGVPYGYRLIPPVFLSGGVVSTYRTRNAKQVGSLLDGAIGEGRISDTPRGTVRDIIIGRSNDLTASTQLTSEVIKSEPAKEQANDTSDGGTVLVKQTTRYVYRISLKNYGQKDANVIVSLSLEEAEQLASASEQPTRIEGNVLEWNVLVPHMDAGEEVDDAATTAVIAVDVAQTIRKYRPSGAAVGL